MMATIHHGRADMNEYNVKVTRTEYETVTVTACSTAEAEAIAYAYAVQGHADYGQPSVEVKAEMISEGVDMK